MTDNEMVNLIEHYCWTVQPTLEGEWAVEGSFGSVRGATVRRAIDAALKAQMEWALSTGTRHR